jgi:hypothetical protein
LAGARIVTAAIASARCTAWPRATGALRIADEQAVAGAVWVARAASGTRARRGRPGRARGNAPARKRDGEERENERNSGSKLTHHRPPFAATPNTRQATVAHEFDAVGTGTSPNG